MYVKETKWLTEIDGFLYEVTVKTKNSAYLYLPTDFENEYWEEWQERHDALVARTQQRYPIAGV